MRTLQHGNSKELGGLLFQGEKIKIEKNWRWWVGF